MSTDTTITNVYPNTFGGLDYSDGARRLQVRVGIEDDERTLYRFDGHQVAWSVRFSANIEPAVWFATLDAALVDAGLTPSPR